MKGYIQLFEYYRLLADSAIAQLPSEESLFWSPSNHSNSIAIIIQHLAGNMKSRWTDFLTSDGEKDFRDRDQEFELFLDNKSDLIDYWNQGWDCLFTALAQVNPDNKDQLVYIRNKGHTIDEAIQRQLAHYSYHIGQIVYLSRIIAGDNWKSLSIPKGTSRSYNKSAFEGGQRKEHFTEALVKK